MGSAVGARSEAVEVRREAVRALTRSVAQCDGFCPLPIKSAFPLNMNTPEALLLLAAKIDGGDNGN